MIHEGVRKSMPMLVAEHVVGLYEAGDNCPRIGFVFRPLEELGRVPQGRCKIRNFLHDVRKCVMKGWDGLNVCSISEAYYSEQRDSGGKLVRRSFKDRPPESMEEARMCVPTGRGDGIAGLYFPKTAGHDLIYMASRKQVLVIGTHMQFEAVETTGEGIKNGVLSSRRASVELKASVRLVGDDRIDNFTDRALKIMEQIMQLRARPSDGDSH